MVCLCIGCKWMKFDDLKLHILTVRRKACFAKILLDNFHAWNFIMPSPWQNFWAVETAGSKTEEVVRDADLETTLFVVTEELLAPWLNCLMPWPCLALFLWHRTDGMHTFPGGPMNAGRHHPFLSWDLQLETHISAIPDSFWSQTLCYQSFIDLAYLVEYSWKRPLGWKCLIVVAELFCHSLSAWNVPHSGVYSVSPPMQKSHVSIDKEAWYSPPCLLIHAITEALTNIKTISWQITLFWKTMKEFWTSFNSSGEVLVPFHLWSLPGCDHLLKMYFPARLRCICKKKRCSKSLKWEFCFQDFILKPPLDVFPSISWHY